MRCITTLVLVLGIGPVALAGEPKPPPDPAAEYSARAGKLAGTKDPKPWLALADFAEEHLLWDRREEALRKAVEVDPDNALAHERLDEAKAGKDWVPADEAEAQEEAAMTAKGLVFYGAGWVSPAEAEKRRVADSKEAGWPVQVRLDTPNLAIYSARSLAFTRRLASVLENELDAYRRFHIRIWNLPAKLSPVKVLVFADRESFVSHVEPIRLRAGKGRMPPSTPGMYLLNVLYVGMLEGQDTTNTDLVTTIHEMFHCLDERWAGLNSINTPIWVLEGRATHFAYSLRGRRILPGNLAFPADDNFAEHIPPAIQALALSELVGLNRNTFGLKPQQAYPVSTTFVHFLFHAEQGRHRAGFRKFLSGLPAKGSAKDLEAALGVPLEKLEPAFKDYVEKELIPSIRTPSSP